MITEYPSISRAGFPEHASDIEAHTLSSGFVVYVSRADVEKQRANGNKRVPCRNKSGRWLSCVWDEIKSERARNRFAEKHCWPFLVHLGNLDQQQIRARYEQPANLVK